MSPVLIDHLEAFTLTFIATFLTSIGGLLTSVKNPHFTGAFILALVIASSQAALKVAWNKTLYGTVAGRQAPSA